MRGNLQVQNNLQWNSKLFRFFSQINNVSLSERVLFWENLCAWLIIGLMK